MVNASSALVAVSWPGKSDPLKVSVVRQDAPGTVTPIVQMFLAKLASLEQKVNALAVARPTSMQPQAGPSQSLEPGKLRRLFD